MICERCHTTEATVHISTILHVSPAPHVDHFCPSCAEVVQEANPLLHPGLPSLPVTAGKPVMFAQPRRKIRTERDLRGPQSDKWEKMQTAMRTAMRPVAEKLGELDPILRTFCERRGFVLQPFSDFPARSIMAEGRVRRYLGLLPETPEFVERGFYPEMPWTLRASAVPRAGSEQQFPVAFQFGLLNRVVFSGIPFSELAGVLAEKLEHGITVLQELTSIYLQK